jgi:hypothetical protein
MFKKRRRLKMNKIIFDEREEIFFLIDDRGKVPIPPGLNLQGYFYFKIRLKSTRGNKFAWWRAGAFARLNCINDSPFEPVFRGIIEGFVWNKPNSIERERYEILNDNFVVQGGSGVINWVARVVEPVVDRYRDYIRNLIPVDENRLFEIQGNLRIYKLDNDLDVPYFRCGFYRYFLNHFIVRYANFFYRVVDGIYYAVLEVGNLGTYILSQDHFDKPVRLNEGVYLLTHPLPVKD